MGGTVFLESDFLAHLRALGLSETTCQLYEADLRSFFGFAERTPQQIERADIRAYFATELSSGISARSVARRLASLRKYFAFLLDIEELTADPTFGIIPPKQPKKLQRAASQQEVEQMAAIGSLRERAIVLVLFASGLRASELLKLTRDDVDLDTLVIRVTKGKGSKDGIAPLTQMAADALREYIEAEKPTDRLFPFTRQNLWAIIHDLSTRAFGRAISPHRLRAGCATAMLRGGADIRVTQVVLRHSSIDTTQLYLDVDPELLRQSYYKFHPRAL